jgi:phosphopantothenoylcysteine synthetase/decarboxylase
VILISGPSSLPAPYGAVRIDVQTAVQMKEAVHDAIEGAQVIVMAATKKPDGSLEANRINVGRGVTPPM